MVVVIVGLSRFWGRGGFLGFVGFFSLEVFFSRWRGGF